ncbi:MAG: isocitrate lyase/phosphoenolpyruvate mutase family protein, partial [Hyphomicrobiales bacterium]|nr:isocitrate lyase/phosphoenolpyruvate mutase family protein [Hyphomicrobiales bacterium]
AAGADLLYAPNLPSKTALAEVIGSVTKPVNALAVGPLARLSVPDLAGLGVRRISTGSMIARVTHAVIRDLVSDLLDKGSFSGFAKAASGDEISALLARGS